MEPSKLLEELFDKKKIVLLKYFLDHPGQEYGVRELAKTTRLALATTHRILQRFVAMGLVETRKIKKLTLYRLRQGKTTAFFDDLLAVKKTAIEEFLEGVATLPGVVEVLQHGKATKEKVSLLVVGRDLDVTALNRLVGEIKAKYGFTILHMTLSPEQYQQMLSMGLYAGEKKTLYRR